MIQEANFSMIIDWTIDQLYFFIFYFFLWVYRTLRLNLIRMESGRGVVGDIYQNVNIIFMSFSYNVKVEGYK